ncbi:hypothetical protein BC828DRAFT_382809 [Blastocladiella britannica]|nr:hypothetical protein BC828DRAFT_382809 [Blastocladiella britannica]
MYSGSGGYGTYPSSSTTQQPAGGGYGAPPPTTGQQGQQGVYGAPSAGGYGGAGGGYGGYQPQQQQQQQYGQAQYGQSQYQQQQQQHQYHAGGGGGGFDPVTPPSYSQGGGSSSRAAAGGASGGRSRFDQSIRPLTLRQLAVASQSGDGAPFMVDGVDVALATVVGLVTKVHQTPTFVTLTLSDHSATHDVRMYLTSGQGGGGGGGDAGPAAHDARAQLALDAAKEGAWVRAVGPLKSWQNRRHLLAHSIRPITDYNEVVMHSMHAIAHHLLVTRGPSPKAAAKIASRGGAHHQQSAGAPMLHGSQPGYGYGAAATPTAQPYGTGAPAARPYGGGGGGGGGYGQAGYQQQQQHQQYQQQPQQQQYGGYQPPPPAPAGGPGAGYGAAAPLDFGNAIKNALYNVYNSPQALGQEGLSVAFATGEVSRVLQRTVTKTEMDQAIEQLTSDGQIYQTSEDHYHSTSA